MYGGGTYAQWRNGGNSSAKMMSQYHGMALANALHLMA